MGGDCEGVGGGGSCRWATGGAPSGVRGIFGLDTNACMYCGCLRRRGRRAEALNEVPGGMLRVCVPLLLLSGSMWVHFSRWWRWWHSHLATKGLWCDGPRERSTMGWRFFLQLQVSGEGWRPFQLHIIVSSSGMTQSPWSRARSGTIHVSLPAALHPHQQGAHNTHPPH